MVQPGETLYRIAVVHGLDPKSVAEDNRISDVRQLKVGQVLCLAANDAAGGSATVERSEALRAPQPMTGGAPPPRVEGEGTVSVRPASPLAPGRGSAGSTVMPGRGTSSESAMAGSAGHSDLAMAGSRGSGTDSLTASSTVEGSSHTPSFSELVGGHGANKLEWPLRGVVYGRFGKRGGEPHDGIDLAAPAGTPVRTAGAGRVLYAGEQRGYGLLVIVEHAPGKVTLYAHNRDLRVREGQEVRDHQVIATVGESGRTTGPHLHFEVRINGIAVDPLAHLGPAPPAG